MSTSASPKALALATDSITGMIRTVLDGVARHRGGFPASTSRGQAFGQGLRRNASAYEGGAHPREILLCDAPFVAI